MSNLLQVINTQSLKVCVIRNSKHFQAGHVITSVLSERARVTGVKFFSTLLNYGAKNAPNATSNHLNSVLTYFEEQGGRIGRNSK